MDSEFAQKTIIFMSVTTLGIMLGYCIIYPKGAKNSIENRISNVEKRLENLEKLFK